MFPYKRPLYDPTVMHVCGFLSVCKLDLPNLVICLDRTPTFERYVVNLGSNDIYQKDVCLKKLDYVFKI